MLEDLMNEIYGSKQLHEETEQEKKERNERESEETIRMLQAMAENKK